MGQLLRDVAAPDGLEQPTGFLHAFSPQGDIDLERTPALGRERTIERFGLNLKRYPVVYYCHCALDAMLMLLGEPPLQPEQIEHLSVLVSPTESLILKQDRPQNGLEAKFSMELALATALVAGRVGLPERTDAFVRRPDVQALLPRVDFELTDEVDPTMTTRARFKQVTVTLTNGTILANPRAWKTRGSAERPLSREKLWGTFHGCARDRLSEAEAQRRFACVQDLARRPKVAEVLRQ